MTGPLDMFFKVGEKVTKGDPNRQADFVYYMVWIIFTAFFIMFVSNAYRLFFTGDIDYAVWTLVGFAVCGIQYFSLKGMYDLKKMKKEAKIKQKDTEIDSVDEMMKQFNGKENSSTTKSKSKI